MNLHADFDQRVLVHAEQLDWVSSPIPGVDRRMLDRIGDEVARATSIVRYAKGSHFSPHVHSGGEEFLVLEGVFQDEHGDFPAGSYIRNPPGSKHTPGSEAGCVIFVKLWQFDPNDREHVRLNVESMTSTADAERKGVQVTSLYQDDREMVQLETWAPNTKVNLDVPQGAELFVLAGSIIESAVLRQIEGQNELTRHSWLRLPIGSKINAISGSVGAKIWVKYGHLPYV